MFVTFVAALRWVQACFVILSKSSYHDSDTDLGPIHLALQADQQYSFDYLELNLELCNCKSSGNVVIAVLERVFLI
jgi:hypothetical protein